MISQLNPYLNPDFDSENSVNYLLLLSISEEVFSYMVLDNNTLMAVGKDLPIEELAKPLTLCNREGTDYKQVVAGIIPKDISIIPNELFNENKLAEFKKFMHADDGDIILGQTLDSDNHIIFNRTAGLDAKITADYPSASIVFGYKGWLEAIAKRSPFNEDIYADVQPGQIRVANFRDGKLRFFNRYNVADQHDVVYYIALVTQELSINKDDVLIRLSGDVTANDSCVEALKEFFRQVEINKITLPEHLPDDIEPQQILALSALQLCV